MTEITHVRMCVNPDGVCLQGGCGWCNDGTFKTVDWLRDYAGRNGLIKDFDYGRTLRWPNREVRIRS